MHNLSKLMQAQFDKMCATGKLFRSSLTGREIWYLYLESFTKENNPIFRDPASSEHNCNLCNSFIRRYGNIVSVDEDLNIMTIFDVDASEEYADSLEAISQEIKSSKIDNVFIETAHALEVKDRKTFRLGTDKNVKRYTKEEAEMYGVVKPGEIRTFNHFHLYLPEEFVSTSTKSVESLSADFRDAKNVFQRTMEEISIDTLYLVRDLINQGSLLDGQTHLYKVEQIIPLKKIYDSLAADKKDSWCWVNSYKLPFAKFKNELIGVLCSELSEGEELNKACNSWNKRVDPVNYMKAKAPITQRQIEEAKKFVEENGYAESFDRRFATIDDIKASEILHVNVGNNAINKISIFDGVKSTSTRHKRNEFNGIEEVPIEKFMKDILPTCTSVEAFLMGNHERNMVSLTTSNVEDSKPIFKWNNQYSWTFNGNLAGKTQIKEAVKQAGGRVDGVMRFSIIWNDADGRDNSDLDAWCKQPNAEKIGYSTHFRKDHGNKPSSCGGLLDLDNTSPSGKLAIENIYFQQVDLLKNGVYKFYVHQFANRNSQGFKAEVEIDGDVYTYAYNKAVSGNVDVASVTVKNGKFSIEHHLPESHLEKDIYGLKSEQFHKVNLICLSPNHWGDNQVGNLHYFFMLDNCKCPTSIRTFHNENLIPELLQHRKVLEVLGNTTMIEPAEKQLTGLGFNATVKDELIVKLQGSFKRTIKIIF